MVADLCMRGQHLQHGQVAQGEVSEARDIEEAYLVSALLKVALGKGNG